VALTSGVVLASSVGVAVGDDVGELMAGSVGVEVAVTGTPFPTSMATPIRSAADSVWSELTSAWRQPVPSNSAMIAPSTSEASTKPLQSASPRTCALTAVAARTTWTAAQATTIRRHILDEGSGTLPQLCIPTPARAHPTRRALLRIGLQLPKVK